MYESDSSYAKQNAEMNLGKRFIGGGSPMTAPPAAADRPRLAMQLDQLAKVLTECHLAAGNLDQAADRILGPIPQDCAKEGPSPVPSSLEQKLAMAIAYAENLCGRLHSTSQRLNSAV